MRFRLKKGIEESTEKPELKRKQIIITSVVLILLIAAITGFAISKTGKAKNSYQGNLAIEKDSCKLFNLQDAKKLLGKSAEASNNNANAVSSRATVSTCSYSSGAKNVEDLIALTVLVRSSNKIQARQAFELARAPKAQDVKDFGDQAYYNPETSQLNILKNESWIIIASTKGTSGKGSLALPKEVAEVILSRLQ